ncbi:FHA domain-containing protein [Gordonia iterans]
MSETTRAASGPDGEQVRVSLVPGDGVVIRKPDFLCVLGPQSAALAEQVLALPGKLERADAGRRGRRLARGVAELVAAADLDEADVAFAAPDSVGITLFLTGRVFGEIDGRRVEPLEGRPFEQAIPWPFLGLCLVVAGSTPDPAGEERFDLVDGVVPAAAARLHSPQTSGATEFYTEALERVRRELAEYRKTKAPNAGDGARNVGDGAPVAEPELAGPATARTQDAAEHDDEISTDPVSPPERAPEPFLSASLAPEPGARQAGPPGRSALPASDRAPSQPGRAPLPTRSPRSAPGSPAPFQSAPLAGQPGRMPNRDSGGARPPRPARPPLPVAEPAAPLTPPPMPKAKARPTVIGVRCVNGHLNHPDGWICGACGIRMDQMTTIPVEGERPSLGWLLLDSGEVFSLDDDIVIGRVPLAPAERSADRKSIVVHDAGGAVSRRHLEVRLVEWDVFVVDLASSNGTFVTDPGPGSREVRLIPHQMRKLVPGSRIRVGSRMLTYESPHARL